jgi:hypothetical protein
MAASRTAPPHSAPSTMPLMPARQSHVVVSTPGRGRGSHLDVAAWAASVAVKCRSMLSCDSPAATSRSNTVGTSGRSSVTGSSCLGGPTARGG